MRYLILSDIHSNRQALEAVVRDSAGAWDVAVCLGDVVGYGADPAYAVDWVRANAKWVVRGNHDKAAAGLEDVEWFNPAARFATYWTQSQLAAADQEWLRGLPQGPLALDDFQLVHGSPLDEDDYVIGVRQAEEVSPYLDRPVSFFGHSHLQGGFLLGRFGTMKLPRVAPDESERVVELGSAWYLVNPGSTGQPRDGDPRAAYAIYDADRRLVEYRRTPYDVGEAQRRIRAAGLPDALAERLAAGT